MLLLLLACGVATAPSAPSTPASVSVESEQPAQLLTGYAFELDIADRKVDRARQATSTADLPGSWVRLAHAHLGRNRLTGENHDIDLAQEAFEQARQRDAGNLEVRLLEANLLQKRHQFRDAVAILESLESSPTVEQALAGARFELGAYEPSLQVLLAAADQGRPKPQLLAQIGVWEWKLGRFDDAERHLEAAIDSYHGVERWPAAWQHLMLGLMDLDRGRYDDARVHYERASSEVRGWWLVEEHLAELDLLQGKPNRALRAYEKVVEQTGNPELIGALADAYDAVGRTEEGTATRARATAAFEAQMKTHGSLISGHAIEFFLEHGTPERALELAQANASMRPNGEALSFVADALDRHGREGEAAEIRAQVRASGWWLPEE